MFETQSPPKRVKFTVFLIDGTGKFKENPGQLLRVSCFALCKSCLAVSFHPS